MIHFFLALSFHSAVTNLYLMITNLFSLNNDYLKILILLNYKYSNSIQSIKTYYHFKKVANIGVSLIRP